MIKTIIQNATINGIPCKFNIEMESIGDMPIEKDGLVNGTVRRFWMDPPIAKKDRVVESILEKDEQE